MPGNVLKYLQWKNLHIIWAFQVKPSLQEFFSYNITITNKSVAQNQK